MFNSDDRVYIDTDTGIQIINIYFTRSGPSL